MSYKVNLDKEASELTQDAFDAEDPKWEKDVSGRRAMILAIFAAITFSIGTDFSSNSLNSLERELTEHLGLTPKQFGAAQATTQLVATWMSLVGGAVLDRFGTAPTAMASSFVVLVGSILVAISTHIYSFRLLLVGRLLNGMTSGVLLAAQGTILAHTFSGTFISTAVGVQLASSKLAAFLAQGTMASVAKAGFYGNGFWLAAGLCLFSFLSTCFYAVASTAPVPTRQPLNLRRILLLPTGFWIVPFSVLVMGGIAKSFPGDLPSLLGSRFGMEDEDAAWVSAFSLAIPIFASPFLGGFIDRVGMRSHGLILSAILYIVSFLLLHLTKSSPFLSLTFFSLASTHSLIVLNSSISLVLPPELVGLGMGVRQVTYVLGSALIYLITGQVKQGSSSYGMMRVYIIAACLSFVLSLVYLLYSKRIFNILDVPAKHRPLLNELHRFQLPALKSIADLDSTQLAHKLFASFLLALIVATWALFIVSLF
ncbi:hypothetical protein DSO57_1030010 [Entomophthora muscae]|uniref:Uncharacterized protein n=1 Tax=Entomophthora muscae TaxID=34485 RepID=A0ACC2TNG3_9FUNG|nr:hypothetical protein DSO57_1030010 [Entomophthora muscae]